MTLRDALGERLCLLIDRIPPPRTGECASHREAFAAHTIYGTIVVDVTIHKVGLTAIPVEPDPPKADEREPLQFRFQELEFDCP